MNSRHKSTKGIALLTVMLIVAIISILAVAMVRSQHYALLRAGGIFNQDQALIYTQAAELFAKALLSEDLKSDKKNSKEIDTESETWAKPFSSPVEGGQIGLLLTDENKKFNINRLVTSKNAVANFKQLLVQLNIKEDLTPIIIDWLDADSNYSENGAEDDFYLRQQPPYRAGNQAFRTVQELRLLKSMTDESFKKLQPYVAVIARDEKINVNTASATVLLCLSTALTQRTAEDIVNQRKEKPFNSVDEFVAQTVFNGLSSDQKNALKNEISVNSHYFMMIAEAMVADRTSTLAALLHRVSENEIRIISRDLSLPSMHFTNAENAVKSESINPSGKKE